MGWSVVSEVQHCCRQYFRVTLQDLHNYYGHNKLPPDPVEIAENRGHKPEGCRCNQRCSDKPHRIIQ